MMRPSRLQVLQVGALLLVLAACGGLQAQAMYLNQQIGLLQQQVAANRDITLGNRLVGRSNAAKLDRLLSSVDPSMTYRQRVDRLLAQHYAESRSMEQKLDALATAVARR